MHSEYLRKLYLHNDLAEGRYEVDGTPVSLEDIKAPLFVLATERDHVSPWQSVYKIHHLVNSPVSFALSSGGHNVGVVSPASGPLAHPGASYHFATSAHGKAPAAPQTWLEAAHSQPGSWWPAWHEWLERHSSGRRAEAASPRKAQPQLASAPGTYVFER
jgi:polyhydroxyalkanoate synthase